MATIIVGSYMVRYPLGGMLSWVLQYLTGFKKLGHDVYFVEQFGYPHSCYDPSRDVMSDHCAYGIQVVSNLLAAHGLEAKWCFVARSGEYHGISRGDIEALFRSADLFVDMGTHGAWAEEAATASRSVLIDGEPGFTQIKLAQRAKAGLENPDYDCYYTTGKNIGKPGNPAPTVDRHWKHLYHPVDTDLFDCSQSSARAPYTTVMNWQSHQPLEFRGRTYGQKDIEFAKFAALPARSKVRFDVAISGKKVPHDSLRQYGWNILDAHHVTRSFSAFRDFLADSRAEFSVCKNVFVANQTAWFSDRSAAFLASGRPVVLQETGFSQYLPTGRGLFAFQNLEEAQEAIDAIEADYALHSAAARTIAVELLESKVILKAFLDEIGI
jgi:hypothetical protein